MKIRCQCGNFMHDENLQTCTIYSTYINEDYYQLLDSNPKSVEEIVDNMPTSDPFWQCKQCGRLYFFRKGKIQVYSMENEIID